MDEETQRLNEELRGRAHQAQLDSENAVMRSAGVTRQQARKEIQQQADSEQAFRDKIREMALAVLPELFKITGPRVTGDAVSGFVVASGNPVSATIQQTDAWDDGWLIYLDGVLLVDDSGQPMSAHMSGDANTEVSPGFTITQDMGLKSGSVISLSAENWPRTTSEGVAPWSYSPWTITLTYADGSIVTDTAGTSASGNDPGGTTVVRPNGSYTVP